MPSYAVLPPQRQPEKWEPVLALPEHPHGYPPLSYKENSPLLLRDTRTTDLVGVCFSYKLTQHCMPMNITGTTSLHSTVKLKVSEIIICFLCLR